MQMGNLIKQAFTSILLSILFSKLFTSTEENYNIQAWVKNIGY